MDERLISTAVREVLDTVVSPLVRDGLLAEALARSGVREVPADVQAFREFVRGPLQWVLAASLGESMADNIVVDLERLGCSIPPTVRPSGRPSQPGTLRSGELLPPSFTPPGDPPAAPRMKPLSALPDLEAHLTDRREPPSSPPSGPVTVPDLHPFESDRFPIIGHAEQRTESNELAFVVVATRDPRLVTTLSEWMRGRARVVPVTNVLDLVQLATSQTLVVLDCNHPTVRPAAVAALVEELPSDVRVVLWGPSVDDEEALLFISRQTLDWIRCHSAGAASLARRCVELVS